MLNLLCDNKDRDTMLCNIIESDTTYAEKSKDYTEIFDKLRNTLRNKEQLSSLLDLDSIANYLEAIAQDLSYEKGFQDGVKFLFECLSHRGPL